MENEKIQLYLLTNGKYFSFEDTDQIANTLKLVEDEAKIFRLYSLKFKNPVTYTWLYWLLPGFSLIDRFLTGAIFSGLIKTGLPIFGFFIYTIFFLQKAATLSKQYTPTELFAKSQEYQLSSHSVNMFPIVIILVYALWYIYDGFTINRRVKQYNLSLLMKNSW